jgi:sodium transport system permease protein
MRFDVVATVFRKELREMLRDRRSLAVMFGIPLVLYPLVAIGVAALGASKNKEIKEQTVRVVIHDGKRRVPHLVAMMNDQYTGLTAVELNPDLDAMEALKAGHVHAILDAPADAQARAVRGEDVETKLRIDFSRTEATVIERKVNKMLDEYKRWIVEQRLAQRRVNPDVLKTIKTETVDVASSAQRLGSILARALPLLLMMTGMLGALFPALNATTTERELGTLETLLVTPAGRTELLLAKGSLVLVSGMLTAFLNMVSMSMVLWRARSMLEGEAAAGLSVSPAALGLTYLAAVPALILFSTIVLIVGLLARNFREANAFATPVMLLPLASLAAGIMEPRATPAVLVTPIANTTVIIREVLTGRVSAGAFALAFASSAVYALLMLSVAARLFSNEQLVNPAWEPLSLKGLGRRRDAGAARRPRRLPALDEALALFVVSLLLLFYVSPEWRNAGLLANVLGNELLLILAPALLFAWLGRWRWREAFALLPAPAASLVGGALLGIGLAPWDQFVAQLQNMVWPGDSETARMTTRLIVDALRAHPALTIVAIGLLAGVCEELFYRGPLQTGFLRKLPPWAALTLGGVLFGAIHMDVHGLPVRAALGILLGWMVWRGRSIFPAMLAHGLFDSTSVAMFYWALRRVGADRLTAASESTAFHLEYSDVAMLAVGGLFVLGGLLLFQRGARGADAPASPLPAEPHHIRPEVVAQETLAK